VIATLITGSLRSVIERNQPSSSPETHKRVSSCGRWYEIEIRFADEAQALAYFIAKFPKVNVQGDYFAHDGVSSYRVKAWRFKSKVFIVAVVPNTRWANQ
jgi:hypothetical protein